MPGRKKEFDVELFRKRVRLFDSSQAGERDVAMRQALQQCAECEPPLLFCEAVSLAYAQPTDDRLQAAFIELQEKLNQRESEAAMLADNYLDAQQRIEDLMNGRGQHAGRYEFAELVRTTWYHPQSRLLCLTLIVLLRLLIIWLWNDWFSAPVFWTSNVIFLSAAIYLFCKWTSLQYGEAGLLQWLVKASIFGGGVPIGLRVFYDDWIWIRGFDVQYWFGHTIQSPRCGMAIILLASILAVSKLSNWLTDAIGMRVWQSGPLQVLRGCF